MTTQKEELSGLEKIKKNTKIMSIIILIVAIFGAGFFLFGFMSIATYQNIKDENHLTNPDLPISQIKNATYTWSRSDINTQELGYGYLSALGIGLFAGSYFMLFALNTKKDLHKIGCADPLPSMKYCPDCGLELSKLDKK